jgi:hypothetical protein
MTALSWSFERHLLQTVRQEVAAEPLYEWPEESLQLGLDLLRKIRAKAANLHKQLEDKLAGGVEASSFARTHGPVLTAMDDLLADVQGILESPSRLEDHAVESFATEARMLERELWSSRALLAEALSKALEPPRPVDWDRFRRAEEAHARGETKPFSRR